MGQNKITKAAQRSHAGRYPALFREIIAKIPSELLTTVTSKQLAIICDICMELHKAGYLDGRANAS